MPSYRIHHAATVILFLALLAPALAYSLGTPFALVDDYGDFTRIDLLKSSRYFGYWLRTTFAGIPPDGRYRPLFDVDCSLGWLIIGPHPAIHHLARWGNWLVGLLCWNAALWRLIRIRSRGVAPAPADVATLMPLLIFNVFVCFFPNQPMARLAPQELLTFVTLGMLVMGATRMLTDPPDIGRTDRIARAGWMIAGYAGLSLSKETNVAPMAFFCAFLIGLALVRRSLRILIAAVPAMAWLAYTVWRVHAASTATGYGTRAFNLPLVLDNLRWLAHDAFQFSTVPAFGVIIAASLLVMGIRLVLLLRRSGLSPDAGCLVFSLGMTFSMITVLLISWLPILRYFYPLVPLLGWHLALSSIELDRLLGRRQLMRGIVRGLILVILSWFIAANYYSYLMQFAAQHHARNVEQRLLTGMQQRLEKGQPLAICFDPQDPDMELASSVRVYFERYLPRYHGKTLALRVIPPLATDETLLLASRKQMDPRLWRREETFFRAPASQLLDITKRLSAILQGRRYPYLVQDAGTHGLDYKWYLYYRLLPAGDVR